MTTHPSTNGRDDLNVLDPETRDTLSITNFINGQFGATITGNYPPDVHGFEPVDPSFFTNQGTYSIAVGTDGNTLSGGQGQDLLAGTGAVTYDVGQGDGLVAVAAAAGGKSGSGGTVDLDSSFSPSNVTVAAGGPSYTYDGIIIKDVAGDGVDLQAARLAEAPPITQLNFSDGTVWTYAQLLSMVAAAHVIDGQGAARNESGNGDGDTFIYNAGYGALQIAEQQYGSYTNVLKFGPSITLSQITANTGADSDIILADGITGDSITLGETLDGSTWGVQEVLFANGTSLTRQQLISLAHGLIASDGVTELLAAGNEYLIAPPGNAPSMTLLINGSAVTTGEFGAYAPIAATKTPTGYDVVFADVGAGSFVMWATDAFGNSSGGPVLAPIASDGVTDLLSVGSEYLIALANGAPGVFLSINGSALTAGEFGAYAPIAAAKTPTGYDVVFSDVGAGTFVMWTADATGNSAGGPVFAPISSDGVTDLLAVGNEYLIAPASGAPGVFLSINGSALTAGEFGAYAPIAAAKTPTGYDVVFSNAGAGTFVMWATDATGNSSGGPVLAPIASNGVTSLLEIGTEYLLAPTAGGPGPLLSYNGSPVTSTEFGAYTPIGAAKTATGFDVVFRSAGANQYVVWATDAKGNYTSNLTATVSGQAFALEDLEPTFGEDLNGDGRLSTVLLTSPSSGNILNLSGQAQAETINLGGNNASVSAGLNAPSLSFVNTPDAITLGPGHDIIEYSLAPSSGLETVANFALGVDQLNIDLLGAANSVLQAFNTQVSGVNAISIASTADSSHGVVLLNVPGNETAGNLLASHTTFLGGHALIS